MPKPSPKAFLPVLCIGLCSTQALLAQGQEPGASSAPNRTTTLGTTTMEQVTVIGKFDPMVQSGGWGDAPASSLPLQTTHLSTEQMQDRGVQRLSDLARTDASVSDAYNAEGYWDYLTVRGFVIDNRNNYRRDGMPINAETSLALDNKSRLEVLKGISGLQAGVSAPGGLVNLVVKRPQDEPQNLLQAGWREAGSWLVAADLGLRLGEGQGKNRPVGLRVNLAHETLHPGTDAARGKRHVLALASDWRINPQTLVEMELESSHRSQPSVPGQSLWGQQLPPAELRQRNINNQPWTQPVVLNGQTGSLRYSQELGSSHRWVLHGSRQALHSDDRTAFPYGCSSENVYDRYCSNGRVDVYDFRSDNESRTTDALDLSLQGSKLLGSLKHDYTLGWQQSRFVARFENQAYNYAGEGQADGSVVVPPSPALLDANTNRLEYNRELYGRYRLEAGAFSAWAGWRASQIHRRSWRTMTDSSGSLRATNNRQSVGNPWAGLAWRMNPGTMAYASWGRGSEAEVVANRPRYTNAGQALGSQSTQMELGLKHDSKGLNLGLALFDIQRPFWADVGISCESDKPGNTCTRQEDGRARHRGLEAQAGWRSGPWYAAVAGTWIQARREDARALAALNGKRPTNVPLHSFKALVRHDLQALPGLSLMAWWHRDGERMVLEDNTQRLPGWSRLDLGLRFVQSTSAGTLTWRAGLDNALNARGWKESPYQFGHVYLFPLQERTARTSLEWAW
jgi:iron complex outermembrane receptor protein